MSAGAADPAMPVLPTFANFVRWSEPSAASC